MIKREGRWIEVEMDGPMCMWLVTVGTIVALVVLGSGAVLLYPTH